MLSVWHLLGKPALSQGANEESAPAAADLACLKALPCVLHLWSVCPSRRRTWDIVLGCSHVLTSDRLKQSRGTGMDAIGKCCREGEADGTQCGNLSRRRRGGDYILVYNYRMSIHCHFGGPGADCQARQIKSLCPLLFKERKKVCLIELIFTAMWGRFAAVDPSVSTPTSQRAALLQ